MPWSARRRNHKVASPSGGESAGSNPAGGTSFGCALSAKNADLGAFPFPLWGPSPQTPALRAPCLRFRSGLVGGVIRIRLYAIWRSRVRNSGSRRARSVVIRGPIRATRHHASTAHPRRGETRPDPHHTSPRRQPNLSVVTRDPIRATHHHTNTAHPRRGETRPGPHHTSPRRQPNLSVVTRGPIHTTHHHTNTAHPRRGETRPDPHHTSPREHRPAAAWPTAARFAPHVSTAHPQCGDLRRLFMPRATREHRDADAPAW
jgi:hypothetical protein